MISVSKIPTVIIVKSAIRRCALSCYMLICHSFPCLFLYVTFVKKHAARFGHHIMQCNSPVLQNQLFCMTNVHICDNCLLCQLGTSSGPSQTYCHWSYTMEHDRVSHPYCAPSLCRISSHFIFFFSRNIMKVLFYLYSEWQNLTSYCTASNA